MKRIPEHRAVWLLPLALVAGLSSACGGDASSGPPSAECLATCNGCCTGDVCHPGTAADACGKPGAACTACGSGNVCNLVHACAAANDPCQGIGVAGVCSSDKAIAYCAAATDNGTSDVATYDCQAGEQCQESGGIAQCVLTAACHEGASECVNATTLRTCQGSTWQSSACPRQCVNSPIGDFCGINEATRTLTGTLKYEARGPNSTPPTDWGPIAALSAQGFLVLVVRTTSGQTIQIDSQFTSAGGATPGAFSVLVPTTPTANDYLIFMAAGTATDPKTGTPALAYVVANPDLAPSTTPYLHTARGAAPKIWSWSLPVGSATPGGTFTIPETSFSGAARVLDYARFVFGSDQQRFPGATALHPFIVWVGPGVGWSCGACQFGLPTTRFGTTFGAQVVLPGGPDQEYWADSVTAHELGHYTMATHGHVVGEGGKHCGGPESPGLAWSEGYATWFSSDIRANPLYIDKQGNSMFWFDLSQRSNSGLYPWQRPIAANGLTQDIDEFEISAMMWNMSATQRIGRAPIDAALKSTRMTVSPFERQYTIHTWVMNGCQRTSIQDTGRQTTFLGDFLDALICSGVSRAVVDTATNPTVNYPYPSGAPLCRR